MKGLKYCDLCQLAKGATAFTGRSSTCKCCVKAQKAANK